MIYIIFKWIMFVFVFCLATNCHSLLRIETKSILKVKVNIDLRDESNV